MSPRGCSWLLLAALALGSGVAAAEQATAEQKSALQAVVQFLDDLGNHRFDKVSTALAGKGSIVVVRQRDGQWTTSYQTFDEWLSGLKGQANSSPFREPLTNVSVTIESERLAHVRADFTVVVDGQVRSHGVDYFTLVKDGEAWKLVHIGYTSIPGSM